MTNHTEGVVEQANNATAIGAGSAILGWLSLNEWLGIVGVALAAAGFGVNLYFKIAAHKLAKRELEMRYRNDQPSRD